MGTTKFNQRCTFSKWKGKNKPKENDSVTTVKQNKQHICLLSEKMVSFKNQKSFFTKSKKLGINYNSSDSSMIPS